MAKLNSYHGSTIFSIRVQLGEEIFKFNLAQELKINEFALTKHLKNQPIDYSLLMLIHKKLLTEFERAKTQRKKIWGRFYIKGKEKTYNGSRPYTDDMAKAFADQHKDYLAITERCISLKDQADTIYSCVKAFEQRKDLLQTISSNARKEKSM